MRSSTPSRLSLWLPVAAFLALIFILSARSGDQLDYPTPDFVAHAIEYAVLGVLLARALNGGMTSRPGPRVLLGTLAICMVWAVSDEVHQSFVPHRHSSAADVASDLAGALIACATFPYLVRAVVSRRRDVPSEDALAPARLIFLTREDCQLCHEARQVLERVMPDYDVELELLDVDSRPDLASRYGDEVPVLLVNGTKSAKYRMDERRLRRRLHPWRRQIT